MTDPDPLLTVTPRRDPSGPHVLTVTGELDHHSAPVLTGAVSEAQSDDRGLILDLSAVTYCDSTGITVLINAYQRAQTTGAPLVLAGVNPDLNRLFQVVGLDQVFTFRPDVEAALSSLRQG
ncbi:STAS domain-containing protein [Streptomyces griseoflavus]|uniref:STAS domain-containing protein n=1 Tax=Streptomyces griseoflavus TaxID=35619 RepID=UPI00167E1BB5|nr:STAS domain-containing protein [Streptomyces griseoflavus]GGV53099.1 anti-sigma factor antagonist [Streptomyces griseoflavus]